MSTHAPIHYPMDIIHNRLESVPVCQLKAFSICPAQWDFARRWEPAYLSSSMLFAKAMRKAIMAYYRNHLSGTDMGLHDLVTVYRAAWNSGQLSEKCTPIEVKYTSKTTPEELHGQAEQLLKIFLEHIQVRAREIIAVDWPFHLSVADNLPPVTGKVDLIERIGATVHLVNFKVACKHLQQEEYDWYKLDLGAIAAEKAGIVKGCTIITRYDTLIKTKSPEYVECVQEATRVGVRGALATASAIMASMLHGYVYPSKGWQCAGCGFRDVCSQWPDSMHAH